jgi:XTP/dITP diphosphohydrolase
MRDVVLATHNPGKLKEFQLLLHDAPFRLLPYPHPGEIIAEIGTTYLENARLKAHEAARQTGRWALADDSGVEVDALGGLPGLISAHFVSNNPWENSREILTRLMDVPDSRRTARMRAVLCLASPAGPDIWAEGVLEGVILGWPKGRSGFGVDPIFSIDGQTALAELDPEEKNRLSHRGLAMRELMIKVSSSTLWDPR